MTSLLQQAESLIDEFLYSFGHCIAVSFDYFLIHPWAGISTGIVGCIGAWRAICT